MKLNTISAIGAVISGAAAAWVVGKCLGYLKTNPDKTGLYQAIAFGVGASYSILRQLTRSDDAKPRVYINFGDAEVGEVEEGE